jgi:hypothetical protein
VRQVRRDREWVDREYGTEKWPAIETLIDQLMATEPSPPRLERVLSLLARHELLPDGPMAARRVMVGGESQTLPAAIAVGAYRMLITESVVDACAADTDLVVELGAGWGRNLLSVWLAGGPSQALYVAAEYTEAGLRAAQTLAELEPSLHFLALPFDFHEPDLSALAANGRAVVFTVYGVEQIPRLRPDFVDSVLRLADDTTVLHFEPVGWQLPGPSPEATRIYAEQNDYNRNLVGILEEADRQGKIRLEQTMVDVIGLNADHPISLLVWCGRTP